MSKASIQLSDHFTCGRLIRFTLPSITMMIFTAVYGVVDGFFVSNYVGKTPFAAVNLIIPVLLGLGCVGFMFGTGGGALIAKTMGQGDRERANDIFSMIVYVSAAIGVVLAGLGFLILRPAAVLMGAEGELLEQALIYGRINLIALPFYVLQYEFQCLFATAEKPRLGLLYHRGGRRHQCGAGRPVRGGVFLGRGRCGGGHSPEPVHRRQPAPGVLRPAQQQPAAAGQMPNGPARPAENLLQRVVGVYEQRVHVPGEHAV